MKQKFLRPFLFFAVATSGTAALVFEVTWTRSLSTVMGSSTYALSTMLAAFMAGLSAGGLLGGRLAARTARPLLAFALCELGIGLAGLVINPLIRSLTPLYVASFYAFHLSFGAFSLVQFLIAFLVMGVPTTLMGMTFPLALKALARDGECVGEQSGRVYSINTLGGILGSLSAGFLLIPLLGATRACVLAASLDLVNAVVLLVLLGERRVLAAAAGAVALFGALGAALPGTALPFFSYASAHRFTPQFARHVLDAVGRDGESLVLFRKEGVEGDVHLAEMRRLGYAERVLLNNGKLEAGDSLSFSLLAWIPYETHDRDLVRSVLSIGLGSGNTLSKLASLPVPRIVSVELSDGILEANRRFLHPELFADPRIEHVQADGRNHLLLSGERYDVIIVSPSWATELASGALLTDEFFALAARRLHDTGVFATWVDFAMMADDDMRRLLRTFARNFRHVTAWRLSGDGVILVGSNFESYPSEETVAAKVARREPAAAGGFDAAITDATPRPTSFEDINTDDRPVIEFHNARNLIVRGPGGPDGPERAEGR